MDARAFHEDWNVLDADVGETKVLDGRYAFVAGDGILILNATVEDVEPEESSGSAGNIKVGGGDVFDESSAARAALDIDRVGTCASELAVADADVVDATGGLAADADASEDGIGKGAVGDGNVFGAATRYERDAVVAVGKSQPSMGTMLFPAGGWAQKWF